MWQNLANALHVFWFGAFLYLYNTKGRYYFNYDTLGIALTSLEVILVVGGVFGFAYFRFVAQDQAQRTAKKTAEEEAKPEARRAAEEWMESQGIDWQKLAVMAPSNDTASSTQNFADALNDTEPESVKQNGER